MSLFEHSRHRVTTALQHPLKHSLKDFIFSHDSLPSNVTSLDDAMTWLFDAMYPKTKSSVANQASLPLIGNVLGDQRVVQDDGDGKAAMYKWDMHDGEASASWHKIMDIDWSSDAILAELVDKTMPSFVIKKGSSDIDELGVVVSGLLSGQSIYGGSLANTNLSLFANNGDTVGNTGFIQLGDNTSPLTDSAFNLGELARRFLNVYTDSLTSGTMVITDGSITDSTGVISFDNENLSTTGTLASGTHTISSDLILAVGSITSASGDITFGNENIDTTGTLSSGDLDATKATIDLDMVIEAGSITSLSGDIDFGNENLSTTGTVDGGAGTFTSLEIDLTSIDNNTISTISANTDLVIMANGTGVVDVQSTLETVDIITIGDIDATGTVSAGGITIGTDTISSIADMYFEATGNDFFFSDTIHPAADSGVNLGSASLRYEDLFLSSEISNGTNAITVNELLSLRSTNYRDTLRTIPAQSGDTIFFNGTQWLSSPPDTEIVHKDITLDNLTDDGHTQFVMLSGRSGGQTVNGGTLTTNILSLRNNTIDGNGFDIGTSILKPTGDNTQDIGDSSHRLKDIYVGGELIGARVQNLLEANISALTSASTKGRVFYSTDSKVLWIDIGGSKKRIGNNVYSAVHTAAVINGGAIDVTTGTDITNALNCTWTLKEAASGEEIYAQITQTTTSVTVSASPALPAGNYKLIGIEA